MQAARIWGAIVLSLMATNVYGQAPETFTARSHMFGRELTFKVDLDVPEGAGPFPAVVLMHGCGGLSPSMAPINWRKTFRGMGYATLIVESSTPRGWPANVCTNESASSTAAQADRRVEAHAAAKMLRKLPLIKKDAVVLMGFSHGAGTAMYVAQRSPGVDKAMDADERSEQYNALIANYPWCGRPGTELQFQTMPVPTPLLILIGDSDNYTPTQFCQAYAEQRVPISEDRVKLVIYPQTGHSFDSGLPATTITACGGIEARCGVRVSFGHNDVAFQQAKKDIAAFLKAKLPQ